MSTKKILVFLMAVVMLLGIASCKTTGGTTEPNATPPVGGETAAPPDNGDPATPAKDTLTIGQTSLLGDFNFGAFGHQPTLQSWVSDFIFCWDENGEIYSNVLESWEYQDDVTIIIKMKPGVLFNTGDPLTAEDILFTLQSYTLKGSPFEPTVAWVDFENSSVSEDKMTLTLKCKYAYSPFITVQPQPIVSKKWCEANGWETEDWSFNPCGSGPYKVVEYVADSYYKFERREDYWGDLSKFPYKYVVARYYGSAASMYIDLEGGVIDLAMGLNLEDYNRAVTGANPNIGTATTMGDYFMVQMWNPNGAYTKNPKVRRALEMAVDWDAIVEMTYGDIAILSRTAVPSTNKWFDPTVQTVKYDPEGAKALLEAEGIKAGDVKLKILTTTDNETYATGLQFYLSEVGIDLTVEFMDFATMQMTLFTSDDPLLTNTFGGPAFAHPWGTLVNTVKASTTWPQHTFVDDPAYDQLMSDIEHTIDAAKLVQLYKQLQEYVAENNPYTPVAITRAGIAYNKNVITKAIFTNTTEANYQTIVYAG
ncbi:MAG: ABC transporter substrate-binding protein [Oscillospiraceae bacterium]|jgi:peptide/nickel transport system substrate-binding protein|nr:ABC transporter substrate-binding protein [Oscillospiraceae bacterium]